MPESPLDDIVGTAELRVPLPLWPPPSKPPAWSMLNGPDPFTVFAPNDDAFARLPAGTVDGLLKDIPKLGPSSHITS